MPTTCTISFDNPDGVYFAGEILRGTITLTVTRREKVRGVYVRVFGGAYTHWTRFCSTDHGRNRDEYGKRISSGGHHVSYSGSEVCLRKCRINAKPIENTPNCKIGLCHLFHIETVRQFTFLSQFWFAFVSAVNFFFVAFS